LVKVSVRYWMSLALVVRSGGHMGAFVGQAYLPQALPAGVSASDIQ
ncbi:DUF2844 domain-containing protein, partial [Caballeronia sp. M23-90]